MLPPATLLLITGGMVLTLAAGGGVTEILSPVRRASAEERRTPPPAARTISFAWAGDATPGSVYGSLPGDGRSLFSAVRSRVRAPDLAIGNLEGTLGAVGTPKCSFGTPNCFSFQASPRAARGLRWAGFDVMNVANNHNADYGPAAQVSTISALHNVGITVAGLPGRVQVLRRRGVRISIVGFSTYPWTTSMNDPQAVGALVRRAAKLGDVVIVIMHAGAEGSDKSVTPNGPEEYLGEQRGDVRAFAHEAIDAGADVVLGSGPHVLRGLEVYRDRLVAYSMGNFAGVKNFSTAGDLHLSALLTFRVDRDGGFTAGYLHSLQLDPGGRPSADPTGGANAFVRAASRRDFGRSAVRVQLNGKLLPPRGRFAR